MNHVFRLIWRKNQGILVPVPEGMTASAKGDRRFRRRLRRLMRKTVSPWEAAAVLVLVGLAPAAQALPTGGNDATDSFFLQGGGTGFFKTMKIERRPIHGITRVEGSGPSRV